MSRTAFCECMVVSCRPLFLLFAFCAAFNAVLVGSLVFMLALARLLLTISALFPPHLCIK
jgi:hypothetical protein